MKSKIILLSLLFATACPSFAQNQLTHAAGIHSVQLHGGCSVGHTWDLGVDYQYRFHQSWAFVLPLDYEKGTYKKSQFSAVNASPGVEASVWQICSWLYLNLHAQMVLGLDHWYNPDMQLTDQGFALGASLGGNLEFFAMPELSFTLSAAQTWKYTWFSLGGEQYFVPLFTLGIKYNIR